MLQQPTILDQLAIQEIIDKPKNTELIEQAAQNEEYLDFHLNPSLRMQDIQRPASLFLDFVRGILEDDTAYHLFCNMFRLPLITTSFIDDLFHELERIFDGKNQAFVYQFTNKDAEKDAQAYKKNKLGGQNYWREKAWDIYRTSINSIMVIDLPSVQTSSRPEPYSYFLDVCDVIDFEYNDDDEFNFIIFKGKHTTEDNSFDLGLLGNENPEDNNPYFAIDTANYHSFYLNKDRQIVNLITVPHNLGFCPSKPFWTTPISVKRNRFIKKHVFTSQLSKLDWLAFFSISKQVLDLYSAYPIYSGYIPDCTYENTDGSHCVNGFIRDSSGHVVFNGDGTLKKCPICASFKAGAGKFIGVPSPITKADPDLRKPIDITSVDVNSLKYNSEQLESLKAEIYRNIIGQGGELVQEQQVNEKQVTATRESKTNVIASLVQNFEKIQFFREYTIFKLRYKEEFLDLSIDWGSEFYVFGIQELYKQYQSAKTLGMSESILESISMMILEQENKNNPIQLQRAIILHNLEPLRHLTRQEALTLYDKGIIDNVMLLVKNNFNTFVSRFERENTNILDFGSLMDFSVKISTIYKKLETYAKEEISAAKASGNEGGSSTGSGQPSSTPGRTNESSGKTNANNQ